MAHKRKDPRGGQRGPTAVGGKDSPHRFDNMPKEKLAELTAKGRAKSIEVRRQKKQMREDLDMLLDAAMRAGAFDGDKEISSLQEAGKLNLTVQQQIMLSMIQKAISGSVDAAEFLRDTKGEKPVEERVQHGATPVIISGEAELED